MTHEPTRQHERVGDRQGRAHGLMRVAGGALALTVVMSCAAEVSPVPTALPSPGATEKYNAEPLLHPKKVGRIVVFFVDTPDSAPIAPYVRRMLPHTVKRTVRDYHASTLGFVPKLPVVDAGDYSINAPPLADRCSRVQTVKDKLARTLTDNAIAKARQASAYIPKNNDFRLVITATKAPCAGERPVDSVGIADNTALAGVIYDGNDEYEVPDTISHELGHGIVAAGHTDRIECNFNVGTASFARLKARNNSCIRSAYGDLHSIMGNGSFVDRDLLNGWELSRLGIIKKPQIITITSPNDRLVRLHALRSTNNGSKIIKVPILSKEVREFTQATHYSVEVSGLHVDEDTNRCAAALQCTTKARPPQGLSVKVYAVGTNHSVLYQDSVQIALRKPKIGAPETGATRRATGQKIFEEEGGGLTLLLCELPRTANATGYADIRLAFQKPSRLVCP